MIRRILTEPYPFQIEGVEAIERFDGRALLADSMGLGKSLQALLYAHRNPALLPIVIVCPAGLKYNWERECRVHFGLGAAVVGGLSPRRGGSWSRRKVVIVNYDILAPSERKGVHREGWVDALTSLNPQLIIIDESHYLLDTKSARSRACRLLCRNVPHVLALSGTPIGNRPRELFVTLNILRPDLFPSFWPFGHKFCAPRRTPWGISFDGASNLDVLNRLLVDNLMIRRRKEDVLKQLPPKARHVVPLGIERRKEYELAQRSFGLWLAKFHPKKRKKSLRAAALVKLAALKKLAAQLKLKAVFDWVDGFLHDSEEKIILYAVHHSVLGELEKRYKDCCVRVDGTITGHKRQNAVDKFLTNGKCRVFLGQIKATGVGWSAKGVSTTAFVEYAWSPATHTQAEDRTHGIGRGQEGIHSRSFWLVAKGTIEERLVGLLQAKQKTINRTIDGRGKGDNLSVFDQLIKELLNEGNT